MARPTAVQAESPEERHLKAKEELERAEQELKDSRMAEQLKASAEAAEEIRSLLSEWASLEQEEAGLEQKTIQALLAAAEQYRSDRERITREMLQTRAKLFLLKAKLVPGSPSFPVKAAGILGAPINQRTNWMVILRRAALEQAVI